MRAAVLHGFGDLRIEQVPDPVPAPGEVVIDVACVQPSVTECMLLAGDPVALHDVLADRLRAGPTRFGGHEFAGTVSAVGAGVSGVRVGARVTAVETEPCARCGACRRDRPDACAAPDVLGFTRPGAFAERLAVPARSIVDVPAAVSPSAATAIQPLAGAIHGHALAAVAPGESVLILGAGVMGLLHLQVARRGSAGFIAITGRSPAKLELARRFGADAVWAAGTEEREILAATDGVGADVVFETAGGSPAVGLAGTDTLETAARCVRRGGRIVVVSVLPMRAPAPLGLLRQRAVALLHPRSGAGGYSPSRGAFEHALGVVARGDVDVTTLVTHALTGIERIPEALEITRDKAPHGAINPAQVTLREGGAWPS